MWCTILGDFCMLRCSIISVSTFRCFINGSTASSQVVTLGIHCNVIANCAYLTLDLSPVFRRSSGWMLSFRSKYPYCDSFTLASKIRLIKSDPKSFNAIFRLLKFASSNCNSTVWCTHNFFSSSSYNSFVLSLALRYIPTSIVALTSFFHSGTE